MSDSRRDLGCTERVLHALQPIGCTLQTNSLWIRGLPEPGALAAAFTRTVARHPLLRARVVGEERLAFEVPPASEADVNVAIMEEPSARPNLVELATEVNAHEGHEPSLRIGLCPDGITRLGLINDHVCADARAVFIVLGEVIRDACGLPPLSASDRLPPNIESRLGYDTTCAEIFALAASLGAAEPFDRGGTGSDSSRTIFARDSIPDEVFERIRTACRSQECPVTCLLHAVLLRAIGQVGHARRNSSLGTSGVLDRVSDLDGDTGYEAPFFAGIGWYNWITSPSCLEEENPWETAARIRIAMVQARSDRVWQMPSRPVDLFGVFAKAACHRSRHEALVFSNLGRIGTLLPPLPDGVAVLEAFGSVSRGGSRGGLLVECLTTSSGTTLDWSGNSALVAETWLQRVRREVQALLTELANTPERS